MELATIVTADPTPNASPPAYARAPDRWQRLEPPRFTAGDWIGALPYIALHLGCLLVLIVGASPVAVAVAAFLYVLRMFALTGFYHRYFAHRTFKTSRGWQFVFAVLGTSAVQQGPLWWAAHHRIHHRSSDQPADVHSPRVWGFLWSHAGWFLSRTTVKTRSEMVPDLACFPELRFLNRFHVLVPIGLGLALYGLGAGLARVKPDLGTNGAQMLVWGFSISTALLHHGSFTINSLSHLFGTQRYATGDSSRNNALLALITMGEGWHNNHHYYPGAVRQGFFWWELDLTYYGLYLLARLGVIRDLRPVPERVLRPARTASTAA
jgi:stearoyl-CoA desaturase (delta-9 desaturase)